MARRWTPQRFVTLRRIRVIACATALTVAMVSSFAFTARKSVALNINGQTTQVTTYAMTASRLLEEQGIDVKTHDIVETSSGNQLADHAVVTVRSAYQTTITIDGTSVPFWTVATSADQLLGFFEENNANAAKITVNINNVYNQLTGGLVINQSGPVTVIADGKTSKAPNGKLPAASILDSKGITLGKEDRISVEKNGDETILRVQRVTHGVENRTVVVPFSTQTVIDPNLAPGQSEIRQQGQNGEKTQIYNVTYVDGVAESETLQSENVTTMAVDQIIAIGPAKAESSTTDSGSTDNNQGNSGSNKPNDSADNSSNESSKPTGTNKPDNTDNKPTAIRAIPTTATRAIPAATPVIPAATQAAPITPKTGTPEAPIVRHLPPRRIRLHRAVFGIRPWLRRNPMRPAPQPSAAGPAMTGLAWSNCGTVNPAGSGTRKTSHPAPTAYRSRCRPAKWPHSAPTIAMMPPCKSIGACGTSPNATAARP